MNRIIDAWPVVAAFVIGGLLGYSLDALIYLATGRCMPNFQPLRNHTEAGDYTPRNHTGEVELAITQDPDRWPVGGPTRHLGGRGRRYIISRHEDLGSISVIGVGRVRQWRVWGRPA
jgi:hypothetical protein